MKQRRNLLIGLFLGALIGWVLGFLRLPYLEKNNSFWLGLVTGLAFVSLALVLLSVWNKNVFLLRLMGRESAEPHAGGAIRHYTILWVLVAAFIFLGGLVSSVLIYRQSQAFQSLTRNQNQKILQQSELIESNRKSSLVFLMNHLFDRVDEELKNNPNRSLSEETLARIQALGHSLQPYRYLEGDSLSANPYSPERGQLLLTLFLMNLDPSAFEQVILHTSFAGADLRGADLSKASLAEVNLAGAYLGETNFASADLQGADLKDAYLREAHFRGTELTGADMKRARLTWADFNEAILRDADLSGADLTSTKLKKSDLSGADLKWADLSGAFLNDANLVGTYFLGTNFFRTDLSNANLKDAYLSLSKIEEVNLRGAELTNAVVNDEKWLEKLSEWRVTGASEIQEQYELVGHESVSSLYRLRKISP